jgi:hypothetical protein
VRLRLVILATIAFGALYATPEALAKPPTLLTVGHVNGHPTATWSLPPGVEAKVAEVATSPLTSSDGYFFSENVVSFDTLQPTQTSWTYGFQEAPGTYYVHIAGIDDPCFMAGLCPVREFSQVMTLVIPASAPPPSPVATASITVFRLGSGTGTVTSDPPGITCPSDCDETYLQGIHVTLTATPSPGSSFTGWTNVHCGASLRCELVMFASFLPAATFSLVPAASPPASPPAAPPTSPPVSIATVDTVAPRVSALPAAGAPGATVRLRFTVSDASRRTREQVVIYRGQRVLARRTRPMAASPVGQVAFVRYQIPRNAKKDLRFCVIAWDPAGNASRRSCNQLAVL